MLFTALLVCAVPGHARVSLRWGTAGSTPQALNALGGALAYESDIDINAGKGHLYVYGFEGGIEALLPGFRRQFDNSAFSRQSNMNSTLRFVTVERENGILRLVLAYLPTHDKTIVFAMEQSSDAWRDSQKPPSLDVLQKRGPIPMATPTFYARDERIGLSMMVQETDQSPRAVHQAFLSHLRSAGWLSALPLSAESPNAESHFAVHVKGDLTCISLASQDSLSGITRITVLHKQSGLNRSAH